MRVLLSTLVLAGMAALPVAAARGETLALTYEIRKDSEPIGREAVRIARQGPAETVEVETHTRAKVLFLNFHYDHVRREEWQGGRLVRMVADTDDDGAKSHLDATAAEGGWALAVNGKPSERSGDSLPLSLWGKAILGKKELFSIIDAKSYRVEVSALGKETVTIAGKAMAADHYRITGDVERELWYGGDGLLVRTTFQRAGYPIEMVRID